MIVGLFASATSTLDQARNGLDVLGRGAGPQAMATTELYLALADMDARVADVLLMGTDHDLGSGREDALAQYEASREQANEVLLQAASLTEGDTVEERNVQEVLDGLGVYERLVTEALLRNDEAQAPPGEADERALGSYRSATLMMHTELLPKAFNLGLDSSAIVRANHEDGQASVALGLAWVGGVGVAVLVALFALQVYLRVRFRRRFNLPLIGASVLTVGLTLGVVLALVSSGGHQRDAKEEGLDAAMSLARGGAIATDMQADQSRYLLDPEQADNHQQVYLERAQQVLFRPVNNLADYYEAIDGVTAAYPELPGADGSDPDDPGTLGYLGERAHDALLPGQEDRLAQVLTAYNELQAQDRELREAVREGDVEAAISIRMNIAHSEDGAFVTYERALDGLTEDHEEEFTRGIGRGDAVLAPWTWLLPVGSLLLLLLVALGVRPRLAEYR
ncbi:hypothetical protein PWG71_14195 [Nocardiopsis sp. N85]|uniref:hypothetical protein n=1 Tax=Nocardiopsis sp. N85 TaxID=3029400 RepID=UPI00237F364D|nr:hypothetical protein [Nocardiopsis sp. N85]MDE3722541.1 hypothetical protein [Nocardiopsis sp. N85]